VGRGADRALPRRRACARGEARVRRRLPPGWPRARPHRANRGDVGVPATFCGWAMSYVTAYCVPAAYKIPDCRVELFTVVTNKCPWNGYRAFGKEAASFLMDRVMDRVADATGIDRAEVRLRNFIQPQEFPYSQISGAMLDGGDYPRAMRRVLELIGADHFPADQADARRQGRHLGLGVSFELTPEGCSLPNSTLLSGYDGATVRVAPSGQVTVLTGVTSPGSGNETGIAQIVADTLGVELGQVKVIQGDTETCPYGLGNYSSRSLMIGGSAAKIAAEELREKMFRVAGKALEVSPADLDAERGRIYVKGAPTRSIAVKDVASLVYRHAYGREAEGVEPGLEATRYFRIGNVYHQPEVQGPIQRVPDVAERGLRGGRRRRSRGARAHRRMEPRARGVFARAHERDQGGHRGIVAVVSERGAAAPGGRRHVALSPARDPRRPGRGPRSRAPGTRGRASRGGGVARGVRRSCEKDRRRPHDAVVRRGRVPSGSGAVRRSLPPAHGRGRSSRVSTRASLPERGDAGGHRGRNGRTSQPTERTLSWPSRAAGIDRGVQ